jgi:hypothetical protein
MIGVVIANNLHFSPNSVRTSLPITPTDGVGVVELVQQDLKVELNEGKAVIVEPLSFLILSSVVEYRNSDLTCDQIQMLCLEDGSFVFTLPSSQAVALSDSFEFDDEYFNLEEIEENTEY